MVLDWLGEVRAPAARLEFVEERCKCADCAGEARDRRNRKMGKGGGDFGARVQIRAHGGSCARTMRSLEDAIRAIGKTGLAHGAARLPRGKGLDVDFAQEKDGDRFVDGAPARRRGAGRCASRRNARKLVTHVATRADVYSRRRRGSPVDVPTQDPKANTVEYQKTILLEVPPISKWDLVVKEPRGGGGPALYLVSSVRREIRLDRVDKGESEEVNGEQFFRKPFESVASADALIDVRVVDAVPLDDASVMVQRHESDVPVQADASRLPLASRKADAVVKAYDIESIVGTDVKTSSRYVLVAPGGKRDVGDSTTTASTVLSRKQQRHAKRGELISVGRVGRHRARLRRDRVPRPPRPARRDPRRGGKNSTWSACASRRMTSARSTRNPWRVECAL